MCSLDTYILVLQSQNVSLAMDASRKAQTAFAVAKGKSSDTRYSSNGITSIKRAIDFSFQDMEKLVHAVRLAMESINRWLWIMISPLYKYHRPYSERRRERKATFEFCLGNCRLYKLILLRKCIVLGPYLWETWRRFEVIIMCLFIYISLVVSENFRKRLTRTGTKLLNHCSNSLSISSFHSHFIWGAIYQDLNYFCKGLR